MAATKTKKSANKASYSQTLQINKTLYERAVSYAAKSGITVTQQLRNGLDELLKKNNF